MARNSHNLTQKISAFFLRNQFFGFILIVISITFLMTFVSLKIYVATGAQRLDLSRPGYEEQREKVRDDKQNNEQPFLETGRLDAESLNDFHQRFIDHRTAINEIDDFSDDILSDENLGFSDKKLNSNIDKADRNNFLSDL